MKKIAAGATVGMLALVGCADEEPEAPVTETVTPAPEAADNSDDAPKGDESQLLADLESDANLDAITEALLNAGLDCPSPTPEDPGWDDGEPYWVDCEDDASTAIHRMAIGASERPIEETFEPGLEGGSGVVYSEHFAVTSASTGQLDAAESAFQTLDPGRIEPGEG